MITKQQQRKQWREHNLMMLEALGVKCNPAMMQCDEAMRQAIEQGKIDFLRKAQELQDKELNGRR